MADKLQVGKALLEQVAATQSTITDTLIAVDGLKNELNDLVESLRDAMCERSERWQESDRATDANEWVDTIEELANKLEELDDLGTEVIDFEITNEPEYS